MAKGYWIVSLDVTDADAYGEYVKRVRPYLESVNGQFIIRGGEAKIVEGAGHTRNVVIAFASYQEALDAYNAPEYQEIIPYRSNASSGNFLIVEGLEG